MNGNVFERDELPGKATHGGYVYVIEFDNGTIKVGRTNNPRSRLPAHKQDAEAFGITVARWWLSPLHDEYQANEQALISASKRLGGKPALREYFSGVNFGALVDAAADLPFTTITDTDAQERDQQNDEDWQRVKSELWEPLLLGRRPFPASQPWLQEVQQSIAHLFGKLSDGSYVVPDENWHDEEFPDDDEVAERLKRLGYTVPPRYLELIEQFLLNAVRIEAINLHIWALEAQGRSDLGLPSRLAEGTA